MKRGILKDSSPTAQNDTLFLFHLTFMKAQLTPETKTHKAAESKRISVALRYRETLIWRWQIEVRSNSEEGIGNSNFMLD